MPLLSFRHFGARGLLSKLSDFVEEAIHDPLPMRRYRIDQPNECILDGIAFKPFQDEAALLLRNIVPKAAAPMEAFHIGAGKLEESIRRRLLQPQTHQ